MSALGRLRSGRGPMRAVPGRRGTSLRLGGREVGLLTGATEADAAAIADAYNAAPYPWLAGVLDLADDADVLALVRRAQALAASDAGDPAAEWYGRERVAGAGYRKHAHVPGLADAVMAFVRSAGRPVTATEAADAVAPGFPDVPSAVLRARVGTRMWTWARDGELTATGTVRAPGSRGKFATLYAPPVAD